MTKKRGFWIYGEIPPEAKQGVQPGFNSMAASDDMLEAMEFLLCLDCLKIYHPIFSRGPESVEQCDGHEVVVLYPRFERTFMGEGGEKIFPARTRAGEVFMVACRDNKYTLLPPVKKCMR
ncbi:MAG: hypothetical protein LiPW39_628 [Parcubacteria group bacterium LiPW_39]|nr:MAG: hypothetical protein LiPW39_628 [Parcubacteria group bacterium LiPW_39]